MNAIEIRDVSLSLGDRTVLSEVSLDIAAREFVGVLGPNGSGKTTLMRALLGLVRPVRGTIRVLGQDTARGNAAVGYVPQLQGAMAATPLRGWDIVASAIDGHRLGLPIPGAAARAAIDRALDLVGARELARRRLGELSGGERQRLLLAQALIGSPRLLLLDEPLSSLDLHHKNEVVELVKRIQTELGIAVLFSEHEINPLLGVIDRVIYLGRGQVAIGTVDEVITGPVLSRLYGSAIEVVRLGGRIFVMSGGHHVEHDEHRHDQDATHRDALRREGAHHV